MLKWAVSPRSNSEVFEQDGNEEDFLTLQSIIEEHQLPCLVRLIHDDINDSNDNYCLLLGETVDPYLIVSNETERFSIPLSFDGKWKFEGLVFRLLFSKIRRSVQINLGLFASVERGVTRYNILQSIHSLQPHLKSPSSITSSNFTHFTTLQPCVAYSNLSQCHIRPGTVLERFHRFNSSPFVTSSSSMTSNRLRTLFANLPHTLNKHFLSNYQYARSTKKQISSNDYIEVKSNVHDGICSLNANSTGLFVPVYRQIPSVNHRHRSNRIQGLYTTNLLGRLTDQYPLITELIVSRTLEENLSTIVEYPFRRITLHRLVENHPRIIAFDMKNYAFIEIDLDNSVDMYAIEHDKTLFKRYQAQLRWCDQHLSTFRSQVKTILHSSNGTAMFIQATPFHGQQYQQYHQRRNSSSMMSSPLAKHIPHTIFTPQESMSSSRVRSLTPVSMKFYTTSNHTKYEQKQQKGKTTNINGMARKDVRVYFNDPMIQKHLHKRHSDSRMQYLEYGNMIDVEEDSVTSFQCTAL